MPVLVSTVFDTVLPLVCVLGVVGLAVRKLCLRRQRATESPVPPEASPEESPEDEDDSPYSFHDDAVVLADGVLVYDAKVLAGQLERAGIPCRMELVEDDRSFRLEGHSGFGQRLRVYVAAADYDRARPFAVGPSLPMGGCGTVGGSISGTFG